MLRYLRILQKYYRNQIAYYLLSATDIFLSLTCYLTLSILMYDLKPLCNHIITA